MPIDFLRSVCRVVRHPLHGSSPLLGSYPFARLGLRSNFSWVLAANVVSACAGWALLLSIVKLSNATAVGIYSLGVAIAGPISVLTNLGLTGAITTDTRRDCPYGSYLALRLLGVFLSVVAIAIVAVNSPHPTSIRLVLVLVGVSVGATSIRDIPLSIMRRYECMHVSGISQVLTALTSLFAFAFALAQTASLAAAVAALSIARLASLLFLDLPLARALVRQFDGDSISLRWSHRVFLRLARQSAPLALAMSLSSLIASIPRFVLEARAGTEALGHFSALASFVTAGTMVSGSLGTAVTPRLAFLFVEDRRGFCKTLGRLLAIGLILGCTAVVGAVTLGRQLLGIVFGSEYALFAREFALIAVHLAVMLLVAFVNHALVASRAFRSVLFINAIAAGFAFLLSWFLIGDNGILGACNALVWISVSWLAVLSLVLAFTVRGPHTHRRPASQ